MDLQDGAAIGLIVAVVQLFKGMVPGTWSKYAPLLAVAVGLVYSLVLSPEAGEVQNRILEGLTVGLGAAGLYSGTKSLVNPQAETKKAA